MRLVARGAARRCRWDERREVVLGDAHVLAQLVEADAPLGDQAADEPRTRAQRRGGLLNVRSRSMPRRSIRDVPDSDPRCVPDRVPVDVPDGRG